MGTHTHTHKIIPSKKKIPMHMYEIFSLILTNKVIMPHTNRNEKDLSKKMLPKQWAIKRTI